MAPPSPITAASPTAPLSGPLADALSRGRDRFNARFKEARLSGGALDADELFGHLRDTVDPIVRAVAAVFPERVDLVTGVLFDISLALMAQRLLGADTRHPAILDAWRRLLPQLPTLMARDPERLTGSICNALHNLAQTPGTRPAQWVDVMAAVGPQCPDVPTFLDCGKIAAWRAGMAQYRQSALAAAGILPAPLAARALGLPDGSAASISAILARLSADPWLDPRHASGDATTARAIVRPVARIGAFRGFGGTFLRPPQAFCSNSQLIISDGQGTWRLTADVFGHVLTRIEGSQVITPIPRSTSIDAGGQIIWEESRSNIPALAGPSSLATDGTTLAVTLPTSHHVFLLARAPEAAPGAA